MVLVIEPSGRPGGVSAAGKGGPDPATVDRVLEIVLARQPVGRASLIEAVSAACLCNASKATNVVTRAAERGLIAAQRKGRNVPMLYSLAGLKG